MFFKCVNFSSFLFPLCSLKAQSITKWNFFLFIWEIFPKHSRNEITHTVQQKLFTSEINFILDGRETSLVFSDSHWSSINDVEKLIYKMIKKKTFQFSPFWCALFTVSIPSTFICFHSENILSIGMYVVTLTGWLWLKLFQ